MNASTSVLGRSSHCASSAASTTGAWAAASDSSCSVASAIRNGSGAASSTVPNAAPSAARCLGGRSAAQPSTGRSSWCSPANGRPASDCTPDVRSTSMPLPGRRPHRLPEQRRLPDPRLAPDHQRPAAHRHPLNQSGQHALLPVTANQPRASAACEPAATSRPGIKGRDRAGRLHGTHHGSSSWGTHALTIASRALLVSARQAPSPAYQIAGMPPGGDAGVRGRLRPPRAEDGWPRRRGPSCSGTRWRGSRR